MAHDAVLALTAALKVGIWGLLISLTAKAGTALVIYTLVVLLA